MARMVLLGVGTAVPDGDRGHTHLVWDGPGGPFLVDAGGSTYQRLLKAGLDPQKLQGIVLTHSHADHIGGLPLLLFSLSLVGRTEPVPVYGLEATLALSRKVVESFELEEHVAPVRWQPIDAGNELALDGGWVVHTALNDHSRPCLALRFAHHTSGAALAYSGDTSPCQAVVDLARGAGVLVHEATVAGPWAGHTTPYEAGAVAAQAGVRHLVLVHFSPQWTMPEAQALEAVRGAGFAGRVDIGQEGQVIPVAGDTSDA
ncbi:MAG: ribonuclease Z [Chloroflexaceae bacterium]|nr:ribonuclease Z [Chloroflexaceae bacterium]